MSKVLAKENRLKRKKDFEKVFQEGRGIKEGFLILKMISNNLNQSRFGVVVSLKISKKAIWRNKIKRRIRELIKERLAKIKKGKDVVLITTPEILKKDFEETGRTMDNLFKKAKLING